MWPGTTTVEGARHKKIPPLPLTFEEGTRVIAQHPQEILLHVPALRPWCHPNCLSISGEMRQPSASPGYRVVARGERPLFQVRCCVGTAHLILLAASGFLRPAARECVLMRSAQSELSLCSGSLLGVALVLLSFNAGQTLYKCFHVNNTSNTVVVSMVYATSSSSNVRAAFSSGAAARLFRMMLSASGLVMRCTFCRARSASGG